MNDETALELLKYIALHMQTESRFLTAIPATTVEVTGLLDKIAELRGIDTDQNGQEFNDIADSLE